MKAEGFTMTTKTIEMRDAQEQLAELVSLAMTGTEVILTQDSTPLARIVPVEGSLSPRVPGLHAGAIWTSADFDDPLPDELWTGSE
jgi:prevent-host-death family protein